MSTLLTINVTNNAAQSNGFFFFQQPAIYTGGGKVFSNSLYQRQLDTYSSSGTKLTFQVNLQYYAGVQEANSKEPPVGQSSGYQSSSRLISLTNTKNQEPNSTTMTYDQTTKALGLEPPVYQTKVQDGAFRIITAKYDSPPTFFNAGSAVEVNGGIVLSNFVNAQPQNNIDCQPILKYYVSTGNYTPGTVMNFTDSSTKSGVCDFTGGYRTANVEYTSNGGWNVQMS